MNEVKKLIKDSPAMRWFVLILISGLTFGTYWFQDFYSGLKPLMESQLGVTSSEFGSLISITTIANLFGMIIIGGIILDKVGIRIAGTIFGTLAVIGAALNALGASGFFTEDQDSQLYIMMVGRILFGSGLEIVCVVAMRTVVKWFKGYELALAMAINMGFGRLGSAMGTALSVDIGGGMVSPAVTFAATLLGFGLLMFLIYLMFDVKIDKQIAAQTTEGEQEGESEEFRFSDLVKLIKNPSFLFIALLCVTFYSAVFPFMQYAPDLLINKFNFSADLPEEGKLVLFGSSSIGNGFIYFMLFIFGLGFSLVPSNIKKLSGKIISIVVIFALFAVFIYSFSDIFALWFVNGQKTASLIPLGTILFTPIFGSFVDNKGKAATLMILGATLLIVAHLFLSVFNDVILGYLGLLSLGIAFSLVPAAMWPSVAKIVAESRLGTAYATMFTIQNYGLMFFFWFIGKAVDMANPTVVEKIQNTKSELEAQGVGQAEITEKIEQMKAAGEIANYDYTLPILLLVGLGVLAIFLAFLLKRADHKQGYGLELPSK